MKTLYENVLEKLEKMKDIPLLLLRIVLAFGFLDPAIKKWSGIQGIAQWFESMNYPLPLMNAYLVATVEAAGVFLLFLGLGSRIISVPLIITMLVAIFTVHWSHGFAAGNNGIEIPLYYLIMLIVILVYGSGKFSVDYLISKQGNRL